MKFTKRMCVLVLIGMACLSCTKEEIAEETTIAADFSIIEEQQMELASQLLDAVNQYRISKHLMPLSQGSILATTLAVNHSINMRELEELSHNGFSERSRKLKEQGAQSVGENVAIRYENVEDIVVAWSNSPSHRSVMEGKYHYAAMGVVLDNRGKMYVTQLFYR